MRLIAFPYYPNNAWQSALYSHLPALGVEIATPASRDDVVALLDHAASGDVLHVNWTAVISQAHPDVMTAWNEVTRFISALRSAIARGMRVVWTIHNELPHELRYLIPELQLLRALADGAHRVVAMNPDTANLVRLTVALPPERLVIIEHPSYTGLYPDDRSRAEARQRLGLDPDDEVLLAFGVIRPYKNIPRMLEAFKLARAANGRARLLVAGEVGEGVDRRQLLAELNEVPGVISHLDFVADGDVQDWYRAADLAVCAFESVLNTGSVQLAATFGVPVLMPLLDGTAQLANEEWAFTFPPKADVSDLAREMTDALHAVAIEGERLQSAAWRYAAGRTPAAISERFARLLAEIGRSGTGSEQGQVL